MQAPVCQRLVFQAGESGKDQKGLGRRARGVEKPEGRVACPEEAIWLVSQEIKGVKDIADNFSKGPREDHCCVKRVLEGLHTK